MAPDPASNGLLVPRPKVASARVFLALAATAALVFSGCGGGDSSSSQTASAPSSSAPAPGRDQSASSKGSPSSKDSSSSSSSGSPGSKPSSPQAPSSQGQAKHGSHIVIPKGEPEKAATPAEQEQATQTDIALASPAIAGSEGPLSSTYTCDGKDSWPAFAWQGVPAGTKELALFVMNLQPVNGKLFFDWALSGIDPSLEGIEAAVLPKGAVVGQNSFGKTGYSICPPAGSGETYLFLLYALPKRIPAAKGFEPHELRDRILEVSGNAGLLAASYARG